jgi:uncharacterized protein YbjT (DUF2867 family)
MRVLVTGGTGYLGAAIVRALHARGHRPVVFARRASSAALPAALYHGDIRDRRAITLAAGGVDAVIHAAALVSLWRPVAREFDEVNVGGLRNVLEVAGRLGVGRVVYTSSFLALPPAGLVVPLEANDYQRTKVRALEVARAAAAAGFPVVTLFPGVVYGPGADTEGNLVGRLIRDHLTGGLPGLIGAQRPWSLQLRRRRGGGARGGGDSSRRPGGVRGGRRERAADTRVRDPAGVDRPAPSQAAAIRRRDGCGRDGTRPRQGARVPPRLTPGTVKIFRHDWSFEQ